MLRGRFSVFPDCGRIENRQVSDQRLLGSGRLCARSNGQG